MGFKLDGHGNAIVALALSIPAGTNYIGKTRLTDGTNDITLTTANADAGSNTSTRMPVNSRLEGFNGVSWDRLVSGKTGVTSTATGLQNNIPMGRHWINPQTLNDADMAPLPLDVNGALIVNPGITQTTNVQGKVTVSHTTSTLLVAADPNRKQTPKIQNQGANSIYINVAGAAAVADATCWLVLAGDFFPKYGMQVPSTNAWNAIALTADCDCNVITG